MKRTIEKDNSKWTPKSWRNFPIHQQPEYDDKEAVENALNKVRGLPPLIHPLEVENLKASLARASKGEVFLLMGGDCAERFIDCNQETIENKFKILLQMSLIIIWKAHLPTVRVARMAGQFAKPRTSPFDTLKDGTKVIAYKGDNINGYNVSDRKPDPNRLVEAYFHSAATLNFLRSMIAGGVADLHAAPSWKLDYILSPKIRSEYEEVIEKLLSGLEFLKVINADNSSSLKAIDMFTSHEGLLLSYEEALTHYVSNEKGYYNLGAHFLWIGDRTRQIDSAHVEYFSGISNPIGVKSGPSMTQNELVQLVQILNPDKIPGRLTIITRYGASKVREILPQHIQAVKATGIPVVWCCDPCHGNTIVTDNGTKTRRLTDIISEISQTFEVHEKEGSIFGGIHLELTGENVTECIGGSVELEVSHLNTKYETFCDPRLNYTQSLDVAFLLADRLSKRSSL